MNKWLLRRYLEVANVYSDSHQTFPEAGVKLDSIRSHARKSVDLQKLALYLIVIGDQVSRASALRRP